MKLTNELGTVTTTQRQMANILGITPEWCRQLIQQGIIIRDESDISGAVFVIESIKNYYKSRMSNEEPTDYAREHAKLEEIKRKTAEIKLEQIRGNLYESATVEQVIASDLIKVRTQLLSLPLKLSAELENKNRSEINAIMTEEITNALDEISEYKPERFTGIDNEDA